VTADVAVGVDIGGTKLAAGVVDADGTVLERLRRATPADDGERIVATVGEVVHTLTARHDLTRPPVGVGAAGIIDLDGRVRYAPNIRWADFPLRAALAAEVGGPVTVDNDANVAAWGEFVRGAGRDARDALVMFTVGTGVGGGIVLGGALLRGAHGLGAELGHMIVAEGGPPCPCGNRGCLEALASGTAMGRIASEWRAAGRVPPGSALAGSAPLSGKDVTVAAHAGDAAAQGVLEEAGRWLGVGVASIANALDPEVIVVGGGAMQAGELLLGPARAAFAERLTGRGHRPVPPLLAAELADDGGVVGAALLARAAARP
jgi:glucokinase